MDKRIPFSPAPIRQAVGTMSASELCTGDPSEPRQPIWCGGIEDRLTVLSGVRHRLITVSNLHTVVTLNDLWAVALAVLEWWPTASVDVQLAIVNGTAWEDFALGMSRGHRPVTGRPVDVSVIEANPGLTEILFDVDALAPTEEQLFLALARVRGDQLAITGAEVVHA